MNSVILEVGVNRGTDTSKLLQTYKVPLHGFEPVPKMFHMVKSKFHHNKNVTMHNMAVGNMCSTVPFYITVDAPNIAAKHGASSLFQFRDDLAKDWQRPDFKTGQIIQIECITLERFIIDNDIDDVVFLHCDAQGNDINVLRGLGSQLNKIQAGMVEATKDIHLYKGTDNTVDVVSKWLDDNGFAITRMGNNDRYGAEVNISFERK